MNTESQRRCAARWFVAVLVATSAIGLTVSDAYAHPKSDVIVLPGASSAEGIARGQGSTFYAGDLMQGDIFKGDLRRGTAELFIDVPAGRQAVGMDFDRSSGLLYVAGFAGVAYVYDTRTGQLLTNYELADPAASLINDVVVTREGAWFTDSFQPQLYFVPIVNGAPGPHQTLELSGPAADTSGQFNLNGITATSNGKTLIVAHSGHGALYTVDPETGASAPIEGVSVPNVDGIELQGRKLYAVQNFSNRVSEVRLNRDLTSGAITDVITSDLFQVPATAALIGSKLAVVNAKFDTGFPPTANQYEVVIVRR